MAISDESLQVIPASERTPPDNDGTAWRFGAAAASFRAALMLINYELLHCRRVAQLVRALP